MIYASIDVAKGKHGCCILDGKGLRVCPIFTITNDKIGFDKLFSKIKDVYSSNRYLDKPVLLEYPIEYFVCHAIFKELIAENKSQPLFKSHFYVLIKKHHFLPDF